VTTAVRWWIASAFARTPLARRSDRIQARALILALALMVMAIYPATLVSEQTYTTRAQSIAAEASASHSVEATALANSTAAPSPSEAPSTTFLARVRWTARDGVHETTTKVEKPVKAGEQVRIWLDDQGKITGAPRNDTDARIDSFGVAVFAWLAIAAVVGAMMAGLRSALRRTRDREWDRGLQELAGYGGGSTTRTP